MEKIVIIDFETTGLSPHSPSNDEILQVACIDERGNTILSELCAPILKQNWTDAQNVHGISPDMVKGKKPFGEYRQLLENAFSQADIIIAYNAAFERNFLKAYDVNLFNKPMIDPMLMFAPIIGEIHHYFGTYKWQKLSTCAKYYGYEFKAHDALEDVKATLFVYRKMLENGIAPIDITVSR